MVQIQFASPFYESGLHNFETTNQLPRHRWYYFKEGFSSKLVETAIQSTITSFPGKEIKVVDPFSGCGTTALTCALNGYNFTGIEVNPFLHFTALAKTSYGKWQRTKYEATVNDLIEKSSKGAKSRLEGYSTFTWDPKATRWIFNLSVLRRYTAVANEINKIQSISKKRALKLAAMAAAFECSNVKRDGKALRYKKDWHSLAMDANKFIREFEKRAKIILSDVEQHPIDIKYLPQIICGDSRTKLNYLENDAYHLVVTSPPYLNSFDYSDVYRPELFIGGYVSNNNDLRKIRMRTMRSHVQVNWNKNVCIESAMLNKTVAELKKIDDLWSTRIPLMVHAYFDDLLSILTTLHRKLKKRGEVWMVIGTSAYGGVHIPVDLIAADIATSIGYNLDSIHCLRYLRAAGQQWKKLGKKTNPLRESLLIIRKP